MSIQDPHDSNKKDKERLNSILENSSYRLAYEDTEFMADENLRGLRLQLELLKPESYLRHHHINSTVVVFGSARIISPEKAKLALVSLEQQIQSTPDDDKLNSAILLARRNLHQSKYYEEARRFAQIVSKRFQEEGRRDFVVVTGGGPGIMEAGNRGAFEGAGRSIGFNITLPSEQAPNSFITPGLCFQFRYFGLRKMHFLLRAVALVVFPGGYGTLDELFEVLTLIQTNKMKQVPIVLVGTEFWQRAINFSFLLEEGFINEKDIQLFTIVDTAEEIITTIHNFYDGKPPVKNFDND